jgi:hypothetical protein
MRRPQVRSSGRLIAGLLAAGTLVGYAAVQQASAARVPTASADAHLGSKATSAVASAKPRYQLGIDIDFYTYPGLNIAANATADISYIKSLHANAVSVSFPFFVSGPKSNTVHGTSATPSPAELATLAQAAENAGLYFSIRPLLDETSLRKGHTSRTAWLPTHLGQFFGSYERFLKPYAQMAQAQKIPEIITGVEFDRFNSSPYWGKLASYLRRYYHGTLAYSNNWEIKVRKLVNSAKVVQLLDAYPIMHLTDSATVAQVTRSWDKYLAGYPRGIVLSEVGIAAQSKAYGVPYNVVPNGKPLVPAIQVHWFDAVCNAVASEHDGGVYYWAVGFGERLNVPPSKAHPADWVDGPGAKAISACFKRLG